MTEPDVPSPCVLICRIHAESGWCEGCARSIDEIMVWSRANAATKLAIWEQLPERAAWLRELGVPIPPLTLPSPKR